MAFIFDSTISGEDSNSYVSLEAANDYFDSRLDSEEWECLSDSEKHASLVHATRRIDSEYFKGQKTIRSQSLEWPRNFVYDKDGFPVDENTIPKHLNWAVLELAIYHLNEKNREITNSMKEDASRVKIGPLEYDIRPTRTGNTLPELVQYHLKGIGSAWISNKFPTQMVR